MYFLVFSVRVRADLSLNLVNSNINGFFFNGRAQRRPERTFVLFEKPQMSVYNTSWVDIPGETQKIAQVTTE